MADTQTSTAPAPIEPDWNDIQARYLDGEELRAIAADHGVTPNAISMRAWRHHWKAQQFKRIEENKAELQREIKGCLAVSVLKEARAFQRMDPAQEPDEADAWSRVRLRLLETCSKLFNWDADPVAASKPAKCIDV